jgi:hypothetical protein
VQFYGLGGTGATIAARYLPVVDALHVITNTPRVGWGKLWVVPLDTEVDGTYFGFEFYGGGLNFPYGYEVEPNLPL